MFTRILIGFLVSALGFWMVWKSELVYGLLGSVDWADRTLGGGGSRLFYKLLGLAILIIGFMVMTNLFDMLVGGFIRSLFVF